jgi:uncharacterized coiled-coil protein SlyX
MARTETDQERDLRQTIAENTSAIARIQELIRTLEDRLMEIQTRHSEAEQSPQESREDQQCQLPLPATRARFDESRRNYNA